MQAITKHGPLADTDLLTGRPVEDLAFTKNSDTPHSKIGLIKTAENMWISVSSTGHLSPPPRYTIHQKLFKGKNSRANEGAQGDLSRYNTYVEALRVPY
mmetsp:Transcript_21304/g.61996  ORF Transcript_21304/g.61996 Transcript_21304/m.61996 type:complete len:99 (+) Transcript_21304:299-595(+)